LEVRGHVLAGLLLYPERGVEGGVHVVLVVGVDQRREVGLKLQEVHVETVTKMWWGKGRGTNSAPASSCLCGVKEYLRGGGGRALGFGL